MPRKVYHGDECKMILRIKLCNRKKKEKKNDMFKWMRYDKHVGVSNEGQ